MTSLSLPPLQSMRDANRRLHSLLGGMVTSHGQPASITPDLIAALLSELLRVGADLRAQPLPVKGNDSELDDELDTYRRNVERLRELLPSIHTQLLMERARIETQWARIRSAEQWARASRETL